MSLREALMVRLKAIGVLVEVIDGLYTTDLDRCCDDAEVEYATRQFLDRLDAVADLLKAGQAEAPAGWQPIETAPKDGTLILVYAPEREGLPALTCPCAYHPDAGFCVDELREPTHWMPLPAPPQATPRVEPSKETR